MTAIVTVNVSQQVAPSPTTLQQSGAMISQGGTNTAEGTSTLLTEAADLDDILRGPLALTSLAWSGNVVTAVTAAPHGIETGQVLDLTIAGATPAGYNGTYLCTITGASGFTYALNVNPGAETVPGTWVPASAAELQTMVNTFFDQGGQQAVYVLEAGMVSPADAVAFLSAWITSNPGVYYSYLTPESWSDESTFITMLAGYNSLTSKTYFFTTADLDNYTDFTSTMKCAEVMIEAPAAPSTEFSHAADFWKSLSYRPSATAKVTPFAFSYLFGVTEYPESGNSALLATLKAASINVIATGAEGGISNTLLAYGTTKDARDFTYWYSVDWAQINGARALANAVMNGSNNPANPLYYDQNGINRLQAVLAQTMSQAVTYGMALGNVIQVQMTAQEFEDALEAGTFAGQVVVNAIPFVAYNSVHPNDYAQGLYSGLYVSFVPARGFKAIVFNLNVTDFVTQ